MSEPRGVIDNLKAFNRKERYFLVATALGSPRFRLCDEFRNSLSDIFGLDVPEDAFAAMDYHIDWVYASLVQSQDPAVTLHRNDGMIHATLEDVDFLVAYCSGGTNHLIFLEAKGVTLFSNKQLRSKIERLSDIFGMNGSHWPGVVPHFAIVSPRHPQRIDLATWPAWALTDSQVKWLRMKITPGLRKVVRCDEDGKADNMGNHWIARPGEY